MADLGPWNSCLAMIYSRDQQKPEPVRSLVVPSMDSILSGLNYWWPANRRALAFTLLDCCAFLRPGEHGRGLGSQSVLLSPMDGITFSGWWFGTSMTYFPINIGFRLSSQLTSSYFSEGWVYNHQPVLHSKKLNCQEARCHCEETLLWFWTREIIPKLLLKLHAVSKIFHHFPTVKGMF